MTKLHKLVLPIAALAIIISAGIVQGVMTNRFGVTRDLSPLAERLKTIPITIGDWSATEMEVPSDQLAIGEIDGFLSRRYVNRKSGEAVNILVVLGRPGPISVHTPDVCFRGAGYQQLNAVQHHDDNLTGIGPCSFSVCDFSVPAETSPEAVRVFWTWSADGNWNAPENPRFQFAGEPSLFKLYAVRTVRADESVLKGDKSLTLLEEFLPAMKRAVFEGGAN